MTIQEKIESKTQIFYSDIGDKMEFISPSDALDITNEALDKLRKLCYHRNYDDGTQLNGVQAILYAPDPELD